MYRFLPHLVLLVGLVWWPTHAVGQAAHGPAEVTTVIVVRHAEKDSDHPRDPSLSDAGLARARSLAEALSAADVDAVYSTQYRRTRATVGLLAERAGVDIRVRPIDAANRYSHSADLAREILAQHMGKTVVVVGHSNTVPEIVEALSGYSVDPIHECEYDKLFVIEVTRSGQSRMIKARYGAPTDECSAT